MPPDNAILMRMNEKLSQFTIEIDKKMDALNDLYSSGIVDGFGPTLPARKLNLDVSHSVHGFSC